MPATWHLSVVPDSSKLNFLKMSGLTWVLLCSDEALELCATFENLCAPWVQLLGAWSPTASRAKSRKTWESVEKNRGLFSVFFTIVTGRILQTFLNLDRAMCLWFEKKHHPRGTSCSARRDNEENQKLKPISEGIPSTPSHPYLLRAQRSLETWWEHFAILSVEDLLRKGGGMGQRGEVGLPSKKVLFDALFALPFFVVFSHRKKFFGPLFAG